MKDEKQEKMDKLADEINLMLERFLPEAESLAEEFGNQPLITMFKNKLITQAEFLERVCRYIRRPFAKDQ
jgi:hypothetical protein